MLIGAALGREAIRKLLAANPPLARNMPDPERQLQPNGLDITVESVWRLVSQGRLGTGDDRALPQRISVPFRAYGWLHLDPGTYVIRFNEILHIPLDVMALGRPRSTLLRCGVSLHTAVWDAGYRGRSESLLVVHNPQGLRLRQNARICQLVFFPVSFPSNGYNGYYQDENTT